MVLWDATTMPAPAGDRSGSLVLTDGASTMGKYVVAMQRIVPTQEDEAAGHQPTDRDVVVRDPKQGGDHARVQRGADGAHHDIASSHRAFRAARVERPGSIHREVDDASQGGTQQRGEGGRATN